MTKPKSDYTIEELTSKIETTKAELKEMKDLLNWYEQELENRKQEVPLGVPAVGKFCLTYDGRVDKFTNNRQEPEDYNFNIFHSEESAEKHSEMLRDWRKDGLVANAKGEPIDIKVLLPLMRNGYVAMDESGSWFWYECKPFREVGGFWNSTKGKFTGLKEVSSVFNLKPADDWRESLMECGL